MSQTRRLAAILAAGVAGHPRLIEADEEGTLEHRTCSDESVSRAQVLCRGAPAVAPLQPVVLHQLVGEGAISQAVGVQLELVTPTQYVPTFDDGQFLHKPSWIAEGRGDHRRLDHLRQVHAGLPPILKPKVDRKIGIRLSMGNALHGSNLRFC